MLQSMGSQRVGHKLVTEQHHQPEALLNHITTTIHANVCSVTLHCSHILILTMKSVGAQYATGDQLRTNSRKNEETEQKQKQHPVMDVTGDGSKV